MTFQQEATLRTLSITAPDLKLPDLNRKLNISHSAKRKSPSSQTNTFQCHPKEAYELSGGCKCGITAISPLSLEQEEVFKLELQLIIVNID